MALNQSRDPQETAPHFTWFERHWLHFILAGLAVALVNAGTGAYVAARVVKSADVAVYPHMEIIDCAGPTGAVRRCIRVDKSAGELVNKEKNATYFAVFEVP